MIQSTLTNTLSASPQLVALIRLLFPQLASLQQALELFQSQPVTPETACALEKK